MVLYAFTIFLSAFLLFQVQPLIGKYILPWFGGSPGVWTTCLLFFQLLLLGGYAYSHVISTRLSRRAQMFVHLALLAAAIFFLPITPAESLKPLGDANPILGILKLLGLSIGLPYLALSTTGPLLQHWFSRTHPGRSPYRLYSLSNVGSLVALVSYPFLFEPNLTRHAQVLLWSGSFLAYVLCCGWCAVRSARATALGAAATAGDSATDAVSTGAASASTSVEECTRGSHRWLWITLPALASLLLLATTNKLTQDVAVIPFLWVLPLALYLLSFILCFDHPRWYARGFFSGLLVASIGLVCALLFAGNTTDLRLQILGYSLALFAACMVCHGELYRVKPAPLYLTRYYLFIAAGGALGGLFVALVAPMIFQRFVELELGYWLLLYVLAAICIGDRSRTLAAATVVGTLLVGLVAPLVGASRVARELGWGPAIRIEFKAFYLANGLPAAALLLLLLGCLFVHRQWRSRDWRPQFGAIPLALTTVLGIAFLLEFGRSYGRVIETRRNFYGALAVTEYNEQDELTRQYTLTHGSITHGMQFANPPQSRSATTYYGRTSGVGLALTHLPSLGPKRVGVVGLGTGTLAAYGEKGDNYRFYDINPDVEQIAQRRFSYLSDSPANITVVMGDARLSLERERQDGELQNFDVLALDAFSSDAIPIHLLTREAFRLYMQHLSVNGIIAVHTSNRYLNLDPAVFKTANSAGLVATVIHDSPDDTAWWLSPSTWVLLARTPEVLLDIPEIISASSPQPLENSRVKPWTDDYASLLPLLKKQIF